MYPLNDSLQTNHRFFKLAHLGTYEIMPFKLQEEGSAWCDKAEHYVAELQHYRPEGTGQTETSATGRQEGNSGF